ncbi:bifunctional chorismate mutase/prephenate dehydratase, partial [Holdemanella sp. DFI.5.55]
AAHQIQGKECLNTALAAKMAAERQDPAIGAIASTEAAKLYDLDILAPSIENDKSNHTRFIIFGRAPEV